MPHNKEEISYIISWPHEKYTRDTITIIVDDQFGQTMTIESSRFLIAKTEIEALSKADTIAKEHKGTIIRKSSKIIKSYEN